MRMIQLRGGDWIRVDRVQRVEVNKYPCATGSLWLYADGVEPMCWTFENIEAANAERDRIAAMVNGEAEGR
jgi:hypothetical protein